MKKILGLVLVVSLASCSISMRDAKYKIEEGKNIHYTTSYTTGGNGCITFQEKCRCGSDELRTITMCGTYTITELK